MIALDVAAVANAVDGLMVAVTPYTGVGSVVVDSRDARPGCLFVAVAGERVDGHLFAEDATRAGAVASLTTRALTSREGKPLPCIVVPDPVLALGHLAAMARMALHDCAVVAITGSTGKTTTKDLVATVLAKAGPTVSAHGSFNTEVGVPLTILDADESTRNLVLEMGMRGAGHIAYLAELARPDIGAVTNVGSSHVGVVGSRDAIAAAKGELIRALHGGDVAVLNADDELVAAMASQTDAKVVTFGRAVNADIRATDVRLDERARASFTLVDRRSAEPSSAGVQLRLTGGHHVSNALAAAAISVSAGVAIEEVAAALSDAVPASRWRMEVSRRADGVTVINDAYNANPESMAAALQALASMSNDARRWAVIGEMRELGEFSVAAHREVGRHAVELGIDRVVCIGEGARPVDDAVHSLTGGGPRSVYVPDVDAALDMLERQLQPGDIVLVKASRSIGLERLAMALTGGTTA